MIFENKKFQKFLSAIILIAVLASPLLTPRKAHAFLGIGDVVSDIFVGINTAVTKISSALELKFIKDETLRKILSAIAKTTARRALAEMTKSTINWINSGFHGKPLFLEHPDSFFRDIVKYEIRNLIDVFGYDSRRYPYGRSWSLGIIDSYSRQLDRNAAYSLSLLNRDVAVADAEYEAFLRNYRENFNVGGWSGLLLHTQYPQNNALGFLMIANEELARRTDSGSDANNEIGKVKTALLQGQGFLSPQKCSTNPSLIINPYNPPKFNDGEWKDSQPIEADYVNESMTSTEWAENLLRYRRDLDTWQRGKDAAQASWEKENVCEGRWQNTTPGFVAASQIIKALETNQNQAEFAVIFGESLAAIFDVLFNKLIDTGLNALASKINPPPEEPDNWNYEGRTLGSPNDGSRDIFSGPDQEIVIGDFKKAVEEGIVNTRKELALLDNPNSTDYGAVQYLSFIWPRVRELDICLPGPNLGWEKRLEDEAGRVTKKLQEHLSDKNASKSARATLIHKELQFAVGFFKDWVQTKMMFSLPNAPKFLDAIDEIGTFDQIMTEITDTKRRKLSALSRLQAIDGRFKESNQFDTQPAPGTPDEKALIDLYKQYEAVRLNISNVQTLENTTALVNTLRDKVGELNAMINQCVSDRRAKGWNTLPKWNDPDGEKSILLQDRGSGLFPQGSTYEGRRHISSTTVGGWGSRQIHTNTGKEKEQFCINPINGGYTHDGFVNQNDPTIGGTNNVEYKYIPLVNARAKAPDGGDSYNLYLSCNTVYRSYIIDYKGNIPATTDIYTPGGIDEPPPLPNDTGDGDADLDLPPGTPPPTPPPAPGTPPPAPPPGGNPGGEEPLL